MKLRLIVGNRSLWTRSLHGGSQSSVFVPSGLVCIHKPKGWGSTDVVNKIKGILIHGVRIRGSIKHRRDIKLKIGHGGTLDPLAEGCLVLGVGNGTKIMTEYLSGSKRYRGTGILGTETDTLDSTGVVTRSADYGHITLKKLQDVLPTFTGDIMQIPPMYSALHVDGQRLYKLARAGKVVERSARPVTVHELSLLPLTDGEQETILPYFSLDIKCSGGTYVRSLIEDIGRELSCAAHMTALTRTKQGPFNLEDCLQEEHWDFDNLCRHIMECSLIAGVNEDVLGTTSAATIRRR
jgi:tRNA pseudouridine55 synthase